MSRYVLAQSKAEPTLDDDRLEIGAPHAECSTPFTLMDQHGQHCNEQELTDVASSTCAAVVAYPGCPTLTGPKRAPFRRSALASPRFRWSLKQSGGARPAACPSIVLTALGAGAKGYCEPKARARVSMVSIYQCRVSAHATLLHASCCESRQIRTEPHPWCLTLRYTGQVPQVPPGFSVRPGDCD